MSTIIFKPIGVIHSPFKEPKGTPIQPTAAKGIKGTIELFKEYTEGLKDLSDFTYIFVLYQFHLSKKSSLTVVPFMDTRTHGLFSTRAPNRPNQIGISIVELISIKENILEIQDVDIVDGTPLIDIKPYVPEFDIREASKKGWLENNINKLPSSKDDGRFIR
ncbi:MAG: tRNA (N6-threonylcarbamoyladenosine(37)-N6)-methyltransferase TrmO [Bacteroidales bacterium]|nr:tRNA (N6-threonylcarbamoyladenosine(37)-N6)-methyltransferase TrmO [Bacteroidales bacterium]